MHAIELEKSFNPRHFESAIYALWQQKKAFEPHGAPGKKPFVIVIPPPNVTGILHVGHGLVMSLIDVVIRFHRMRGEPTLWVPGTDHAGIATQHVVEKKLHDRGLTRHALGRDAFIAETWKVKEEHHRIISEQLARMGSSVDWSRERFTMDEGLSRAVRDVFVSLYEQDLIYKGQYLVNWCVSCATALSDDEVEHSDEPGALYHINYPLSNGNGFLEVATTRPETMLGDTAIAVNPHDHRYSSLVGLTVELPLTGRTIPIIADPVVAEEFGTGALKVTPAHAIEDWNIAHRHGLPVINILNPDGTLNENVPQPYQKLTVMDARSAVITDLKKENLFVREELLTHAVGHCYRCGTVIEPLLSQQWFVRMRPLADKALERWRAGDLIFYPKKWEHTFEHWLNTIHDWCISRQLWWGHRIPAWTCSECAALTVAKETPTVCPQCGSPHIVQDPDVLDTWFSSWLWPFSTLGWPEETDDFHTFYPTTTLITAYDIIFFWVSRMIMAGLECTGQVPFRDVYIHGLLRDSHGRKMSKSLGNGIDPLEIIEEFGADALKFTLVFLCAQGQDILIDKESFKIGSKFANKIWNASRYILMNLEGRSLVEAPTLRTTDRWIYSRLNTAARVVSDSLLSYRYNEAAQAVYEYFWNDLCDWYVEAAKLSFKQTADEEKDRAVTVLLAVLSESLRLVHPFLPLITEEIYQKLPTTTDLLITAPYPVFDPSRDNAELERCFASVQESIRLIRTLRSACTLPPETMLRVAIHTPDQQFFHEQSDFIKARAALSALTWADRRPDGSIGLMGNGIEVFVFVTESVDRHYLISKWTKELERDKNYIEQLEKKLSNEQFRSNAPAAIVQQETLKQTEALKRVATLHGYLADL
ncbi:MAG: valine--tRNA ligase [Treponema sp.]|jgi:valyl-tRNA synthetase|nr:valine--tRNA ligase [Treponema sp.]